MKLKTYRLIVETPDNHMDVEWTDERNLIMAIQAFSLACIEGSSVDEIIETVGKHLVAMGALSGTGKASVRAKSS